MGVSAAWNSVGFDSIASETRRDAYDPPGFDPVIAKEGPVIMPLSLKKKDSGMLQRKQQVRHMAERSRPVDHHASGFRKPVS